MKYRILTFALATAVFASCENKTTENTATAINTSEQTDLKAGELVNNPNTANAEEIKTNGALPKMEFKTPEHDFGMIKPGDKVSHVFEFTNTGDAPLIISNASATCGCTVPEYPREPVAPGQGGKIKVTFDSQGKFGQQSKNVTITANTQPNINTLTIKGNIPGGPDNAMGPVKN